MRKKLFTFLFLSLFACYTLAQVEYKEEKTQISGIKRNSGYVYGEGIAETEEKAAAMAEQNLHAEILRVISENETLQQADKVMINTIRKQTGEIKLKRGSMSRVFLYVSKKNIFPGDEVITLDFTDTTAVRGKSAAVPEPALTPEPVMAEIPQSEPGKPVVDGTLLPEEPVVTGVSLEPMETAGALLQTGNAAKSTCIPAQEKEKEPEAVAGPGVAISGAVANAEIASPVLRQIVTYTDAAQVENYFKKQKQAHKLMWGNVKAEIRPTWYVLVLSGNGIRAVLDKGGDTRTDLLTGETVALSAYRDYTKIWFVLYE